jgi:hypothetical protein
LKGAVMELNQEDLPTILIAIAAVGSLLAAAGLWLAKKLVRTVETKLDVKLPAELVASLEKFSRMGAALVEEQLRKFAVGLIKDAPKTPPDKLAAAVSYARELAPDGLQKFTDKQVALAVEASLPELRARVSAAPAPEVGSKSLPPLSVPRPPRVPSDMTTLNEVDTAPATPSAIRRGKE